jgi:hypothetical protein
MQCGGASAGTITGANSAVINSGGPGFGSINNTFNQAGLATSYVSGVTDFATYIAGNSQHTAAFSGAEWFGEFGLSTASVTYDLGSVLSIEAVALWNEDAAGIGALDLYQSADGITFSVLAAGLVPTNPSSNVAYGADVFSFAAVNTRFIRFDMSNCPQEASTFSACAIGEVAFNAAADAEIPEPASAWLLALGVAGIAALRRRRA